MKNKISFVYFDIGGVLEEYSRSFDPTTKKWGIHPDKFMEFWMAYENDMTRGRLTPDSFWKKVIKKFGLKGAEKFDFAESWTSGYEPIEPTHDLVRRLSKTRRLGLLSNHYSGMIPKSIKAGKVPDVKYHSIVASYLTGFRKPEKEIYEIATKMAGAPKSEILFIDDFEDYVAGAKAFGWQTVRFDIKNAEESVRKIEKLLL